MREDILAQENTEIQLQDRATKAVQLHQYIKVQGRIVAQGLSEIGRSLKEMRDEKLYIELGHETFADYGKAMLGLEQRQLYSYIQVFELYGPKFIDNHAELGISKLLLIANVPAPEREDFVAENDLESLTVKQLRELTERYNQAVEQMSLIQTEKDKLSKEFEEVDDSNNDLILQVEREKAARAEADRNLELERQRYRENEETMRRQIKEMENRPIDVAVQEVDAEQLTKIKAEAVKQAEKDVKEKIKDAREKAKQEADKAVKAAQEKAEKEIKEAKARASETAAQQLKQSLTAIEQDKANALERAAELEKKLEVAANPDTVFINFVLEGIQEQFGKLIQRLDRIAEADPEKAEKFRTATGKILSALGQAL